MSIFCLQRHLAFGILATVLCPPIILALLVFVDRRVHLLVDRQVGLQILWQKTHEIPVLLVPSVLVVTLALLLRHALNGARTGWRWPWLLSVSAGIVSLAINNLVLKIIFGRADLQAWHQFRSYGFKYFHGNESGYGSFPSGHAAFFSAIFAVLWKVHPRWRVLYVILTLAGDAELVALHYHYLSDAIAGTFLGLIVATTLLWFADRVRAPIV